MKNSEQKMLENLAQEQREINQIELELREIRESKETTFETDFSGVREQVLEEKLNERAI